MYIASKFYRGPYRDNAPDLIVGYQRGYRVSWETAIGRTTEAVFHSNRKAWSGDHCVDPSLVPGILFCNHPVESRESPADRRRPHRAEPVRRASPRLHGWQADDHRRCRREKPRANARTPWPRSPHDGIAHQSKDDPEGHGRRRGRRRRGLGAGNYWLGGGSRVSRSPGKKVIIIGVDGMDPRLSERMMDAGQLPNLAKLRASGGLQRPGHQRAAAKPRRLGQLHQRRRAGRSRDLRLHPPASRGSVRRLLLRRRDRARRGGLGGGRPRIPLEFWPFNHKPPATVLRRQGIPFWDYLDAAGVPSTFYDLPSNYPASPSHYGHHRCICGMGTPDMLGTYGTYQHFAENGPAETGRRGRRQTVPADVRGRDGPGPDRRARGQPAQDAPGRSLSSSSSTAIARPMRR